MSKKNISQEKIIQAFLTSAFDKSAGATSLADVADSLEIKKASLYNHFESRDAMYDASIAYCSEQISKVEFLTQKVLETVNSGKSTVQAAIKKLISRYFSLFDSEPLFKMYVFVHTEQYFNVNALKTVQNQIEKISEDIKTLFATCIKDKSEKEIKELASACTSLILQQLDAYIAVRKETIRQNPETGAGSLFELPSDNNIINKASRLVDAFVTSVI
ncbi:MAG: TetR/AcrR family transcriptional regulator [Treponema sp.]|jgi:AcrR family transcriptional regulator|nr:TetR/AcrR family transcriptional regulator [Treponema sp.]